MALGTGANDSYTAALGAGNGSLVVTEVTNGVAKGTFSFQGRTNASVFKDVTEGAFEVRLQ